MRASGFGLPQNHLGNVPFAAALHLKTERFAGFMAAAYADQVVRGGEPEAMGIAKPRPSTLVVVDEPIFIVLMPMT